MANKHLIMCSTLLVIREMQIEGHMSYHFTCTRVARIKKMDNDKCWQGCEAVWTLIHCCCEYKMLQLLWKIILQFLKKLNMTQQIHFLESTQENWKPTSTQKHVHEFQSHIIIDKKWKPKCPSSDEWI